ncbi:MAG: recombinase family protein [Opitutales bacterium]
MAVDTNDLFPDREASAEKIPAAAYVRMSTDHQQYSTNNQADVINKYAEDNGIEIIRQFSDEGKSGLNIQGRGSLAELIALVESGEADFKAILVYDVSRWGRFQDADESAFYEFICKRAGIDIHYCAEQFKNDGSPVSTIVKGVKRAMAGEYSRELSAKVFQGACRLIQLGYRQGGSAGFGLRRMLVDQSGQPKGILERCEQKSIQTDRVILVPGPPEEIKIVQSIYRAFIKENKTESEIASDLNARGIKTDLGRAWTRGVVHEILTNEKYIGNNVYHRSAFKLKKKRVQNPEEMWVRKESAFEPIVEPGDFYTARGIILARTRKYTDEEMLEMLRKLHQNQGTLSGIIINESSDMPSSSAYAHRFGSLVRAYELIGYTPDRDYAYIEVNRYLKRLHPEVLDSMLEKIRGHGASIQGDVNDDVLWINGEVSFTLSLARCQSTAAGSARWTIRLNPSANADFSLVARMAPDNKEILDYYILPRLDFEHTKLKIAEHNGIYLDIFRYDDLSMFIDLTRRVAIREVA